MSFRNFLTVMSSLMITTCSNPPKHRSQPISSLEIISILEDSTLSIRALEVDQDFIYYGSSDHLGKIALDKELKFNLNTLKLSNNIDRFKTVLTYENQPLHFRAISVVNSNMFGITIGNPARLYRIPRKSTRAELVYEEVHESVFYDAMAFWNPKEGLAIGDPTDECMSIIITRDGGRSWDKLSCADLPESLEGEAAFAASDTNIAIVGDKTWIATGGISSRILFSPDKGNSWKVIPVPIVQGKATTGLYSIDFYDEQQGFGIGGDYTKAQDKLNNKIKTVDGGKTWTSIASGNPPGYRSCVQYIPNSDGKELIAVGFEGIDYSQDSGNTWQHLSDEGFYTIRFINDTLAYAAGKGRISKLIFR